MLLAHFCKQLISCIGTFVETKTEGQEELLEKMGIGMLRRKAMLSSVMTMEIWFQQSKNGGRFKYIRKSSKTSYELTFEIGVPFEHITGFSLLILCNAFMGHKLLF